MANRIQTRKNRQAVAFKALEAENKTLKADAGDLLAVADALKKALVVEREEHAKLRGEHELMRLALDEVATLKQALKVERDVRVMAEASVDEWKARLDMTVVECGKISADLSVTRADLATLKSRHDMVVESCGAAADKDREIAKEKHAMDQAAAISGEVIS